MEKIELSRELIMKVFKLWKENAGEEETDIEYFADADYFLSLLEEITND